MLSKQEAKFREKMQEVMPGSKWEWNHRKNFMVNEKTGKSLEIDAWNPHLGVGFEFQGTIHFDRKFDKIRERDMLKYEINKRQKKLCVFEVFYTDLKGDFKENLIQRITGTQEYYVKNNQILKLMRSEMLLLYVIDTEEYTPYVGRTSLLKCDRQKANINQNSMYYLVALLKAIKISQDRSSGIEAGIRYMKNCILNSQKNGFILPDRLFLSPAGALKILQTHPGTVKKYRSSKFDIEQIMSEQPLTT